MRDEDAGAPEIIEREPDDDDELTATERKRLRMMLKQHERAAWFWSSIGIWLKWLAGIAVGVVALRTLLGDFKDLVKIWLK